jgi:predicted ATPase/DNA-binding CsgD family transcriptional regulator/DNA-binding XRE family transcriptional regulator
MFHDHLCDAPPFGDLLRRHRRDRALTQEALAERSGVSVRAISDLERGARTYPHRENASRLADALDLAGTERATLLAAARRPLPPLAVTTRPPRDPLLLRPLTGLIGRAEERREIADLLREERIRLITLTGPGGVGKTRLAVEVANEVATDFREGMVFVDLAPLQEPAQVIPAIAVTLGLTDRGTIPLLESVRRRLSTRQLLLVLDNFEHLLSAAPLLSDVLPSAPDVQALVTSRAALRLYGEREYPLNPLPCPDPAHLPSLERVQQYEAVRLFGQRARAVKPDFAVTRSNALAVAEICSRLDGLPLAIELAAARIKVLPPQALLRRLEPRLPLLTGGAQTLPARQQTMRDTIAWSHDLLSPSEQIVFRRLAVFPGGFTIEAAEAVVDTDGTRDVLANIAALVDESLLRQEEGAGGEPRFRMLETVREYSLEQLAVSGESDATHDRLASWGVALAERVEPDGLLGGIAPEPIAQLQEELPNLRAAVAWLLAREEAIRALRLLVALEDFWAQRHLPDTQLYRWLEAALSAAPEAPMRDRVVAHYLLANQNSLVGHDEAALCHAQQMLASAEKLGDPAGLGYAQRVIAWAWEDRGEIERAAAAYTEAIPRLRAATDDERWAWFAQAELGDKRILQGDFETGVPLLEEALARLRRLADPPWSVVSIIALRGHAALLQGDLVLAAKMLADAMRWADDLHHSRALLGALAGLAGVAHAIGQPERAVRLLGAVEAAREAIGIKRVDDWLHAQRITTDVRGALPAVAFEAAWAAGRTVPLQDAITEALTMADEAAAWATAAAPEDCLGSDTVFNLTRREREILHLLCQHLTNLEIAERLFISPKTAENHVGNILAKLGASNRHEAAAVAARMGLA